MSDVNTIAVIGAGTMGAGIAQLAATCGCTVYLYDVKDDYVRRGIEEIARRLARRVEKGKMEPAERDAALGRVKPIDAIRDLNDVELAIEAVVEELAVKQTVFTDLERATSPSAVLASNTSSLSITSIAEVVNDPSRVVGMHFFNPAPVMPLVEVISGRQSSESSIDVASQAAKQWGKTPVRASDTAGFIVNRVARGFYLEALRLLHEGVGGVDEIDNVMRTFGGFRMGPFQLMDLVGLDVNLTVSTSVWERLGRPARLTPHEIQQSLVDQGHLGRKTGRGFYTYDRDPPLPAYMVDRRSFELSLLLSDAMLVFSTKAVDRLESRSHIGSTERYILARILGAVINEAALALSDRVASREDIDIAMTKGTNYPIGPLTWADKIGLRTVRGVLKALNGKVSDGRYEPAPWFAEMT
jgi:3-hydroxybutyryl-CoA dehydrogenase